MPVDTTTFANAEKITYAGRLKTIFAEKYPWYDKVQQVRKDFPGGSELRQAIRTARANGVGARPATNMLLPAAGSPSIRQIVVTPFDTYGRMEVSNRIMSATKNSAASFAEAWADAMEDTMAAYVEDRARMFWGDGTGIVGMINGAVVASTALAVDAPMNYTDGGGTALAGGSFYMRDNYRFTGGSGADLLGGGAMVDVTLASTTPPSAATTTLATTLADNDLLARGTGISTADHAYLMEPAGLLSAVDDRDPAAWGAVTAAGRWASGYLGVLRTGGTGVQKWRANRLQNSGVLRAFQAFFIHDAIRQCKGRGGTSPAIILCNPAARLEILAEIAPQFQYIPKKVQAGFEEITFSSDGGMTIVADDWCPPSKIFVLDLDTFQFWYLEKAHWVSKGGGVEKWVENTNSFQSYIWACDEFVCINPAGNAKIEDIQVAAGALF